MIERVGSFEVLRELGRGGMGVVYLARDTRLDRQVAIKALPVELASDPARLERFEREAKTRASLNHPNLAGIYGVEEQDGARYLVLEYVEGESLADRLDRGPLPVDEALEYAVQIAAGVEAAHEAGVVHRDLKPANVMITPDGQAKVLDFGLARTDEGASSTGSLDSPTLTTPQPQHSPTIAGAILGTAAYMSPEQARGRRVDKRTDIWSFGVVVYEMLVGASPFHGETATDSIGAVLHKDLDLDLLPKQTPSNVRRVLERCLVRDRGMRYRDIGDVRVELTSDEDPVPLAAAHGSPGGFARLMVASGWLIAAAALVAIGVLLTQPGATPMPVHASVLAPDGFRVQQATVSPDGRRLVIVGDVFDSGREDSSFRDTAFVRELATNEMTRIEGVFDPFYASFSPDGRWLLLAANSNAGELPQLYRLPSDLSAPPALIANIGESSWVAGRSWFSWTPDSEIAVYDRSPPSLVILSAGTGEEIRRVPISGVVIDPVFSSFQGPFGAHWVALGDPIVGPGGYREDVLLIDLRTGFATRSITNASNPVLIGDDRVLFSRGSQILESRFDPETLRPVGTIRPVHDGLATESSWQNGWFNLSDNGVLVHRPGGVRGTKRTIVRVGLDFGESPWSPEQRSFQTGVQLSPDGQRIAVTVSSATGQFEIWVSESERRRFRRLLADPRFDYHNAQFTPDGDSIIATRDQIGVDADVLIVKVPFDGTAEPEVIYSSAGGIFPMGVSPDGNWILAMTRPPAGTRQTIEIPMDGSGDPRVLQGVHATANSIKYAPAGIPLITYISSESGQRQMYVREYTDGRLGPEIPVSDEDVYAVGWHDWTEDTAVLSYLRSDRTVHTRTVSTDGLIRIGPSVASMNDGSIYLDVGIAAGVGGAAIKRGEDEGPITDVTVVTEWLSSLDD